VVAASFLSNWMVFVIPLLLRLTAMVHTRSASNRLRKALELGGSCSTILARVSLGLCYAGITWGLLMWPIIFQPQFEPFSFVIIGITIVAVALISAMLGPMPRTLMGFVGCFVVTLSIGLLLSPEPVEFSVLLACCSMIGGMVAFSLGSARHYVTVAETLVENRRLHEELEEALHHAEYYSLHDPLTGLQNRRAFFEINRCVAPVEETRHVLAIDLDHFKRINDTFGHDVGDKVLVTVSGVFRDTVRETPGGPHRAIRLGGEEFLIMLTGVDRATAVAIGQSVRQKISEATAELAISDLATTASIGIATCEPGEELSFALKLADDALYEAKQSGRDRVTAAAA
jgi:diguanylate cyclase (GGDEF)-like protein